MTALRKNGLVLVAGLLVVVGLLGWWKTYDARSAEATQNAAVVEESATTQVQSEVSQALTRVLTYDFNDPATTEAAATAVLAGDAREEYDTLFASLQERAPDQELQLTAQVQSVGVKELTDDSAELLVFLDQSSRRADDGESSVSAAQLAVSAERIDGVWKITSLQPL